MTTRKLVAGTIRLKIKAPFLFPGVDAGAFGYDRVALRDLSGNLILPMDQLRGLLRHGLVDLGRTDVLDDLFGNGSADAVQTAAGSYEPDRSALFLSDLAAAPIPDSDKAEAPAHRVRIDPESGAAKEGHLLTLEQVAAPGACVSFTGAFHAYSSLNPADLAAALDLALTVNGAVGSLKSVGFGEIVDRDVTAACAVAATPLTDPGGDRLVLRFTLDRPYLIDAARVADNAWLGRRDIPGGAIKGLLAQNLILAGEQVDADALSALRIGHARRVGDQAPVLPVSVVRDSRNERFVDLSADGAAVNNPVPQVDWKQEWALVEMQGFGSNPNVRFDERVHTTIDADTGAAADSMLYSTIALEADVEGFLCEIDLNGIKAEQRGLLMTALSRPLHGLGMTHATLTPFSLEAAGEHGATAGRIAIILKTDGLLADPFDIDNTQPSAPQEVYAAFWQSCLPNSNMIACFASQRLVGGYHALRFRVKKGEYRPWMLTEPGSVFVLDLHAEDVDAMKRLLTSGLCRSTLEGEALDWKNCPFVVENGYGEIAIHTPHAFDLKGTP